MEDSFSCTLQHLLPTPTSPALEKKKKIKRDALPKCPEKTPLEQSQKKTVNSLCIKHSTFSFITNAGKIATFNREENRGDTIFHP